MSLHNREPDRGTPDTEGYRQQFVRHCHLLVWSGYERVCVDDHSGSDEDFISRRIVEETRVLLRRRLLPKWADRYVIRDQIVVNHPDSHTIDRPKIDIELESTRGGRPVFQFEAKRLRKSDSNSVASYVGRSGLGCFIDEVYARDAAVAGMLGYVQSDGVGYWEKRIEKRLLESSNKYQMSGGVPQWKHHSFRNGPAARITSHQRQNQGMLSVTHTLLDFGKPKKAINTADR